MAEEINVRGVSGFFLALIPLGLAVGALAWIGVANGTIEFHHARTLAERADNRVGVREPLKDPITLSISGNRCLRVEKAWLDGDTVTAMVANKCTRGSYVAWGYDEEAPDGTIVKSWYTNLINRPPAGKTAELTADLVNDPRVSKITVWASDDTER